jgi:hypothetical protein
VVQTESQPDEVLSLSISVVGSIEKATRKENKMRCMAFSGEGRSGVVLPTNSCICDPVITNKEDYRTDYISLSLI